MRKQQLLAKCEMRKQLSQSAKTTTFSKVRKQQLLAKCEMRKQLSQSAKTTTFSKVRNAKTKTSLCCNSDHKEITFFYVATCTVALWVILITPVHMEITFFVTKLDLCDFFVTTQNVRRLPLLLQLKKF